MKPNQLISPFKEKNSLSIQILDKVWYIPATTLSCDFQFPGWSSTLLFGNENPIHIEYCSGNGDWIIEKAKANPHINWVAVEKKFKRVKKIWSKLKNNSLNNLIIICGEALFSTQKFFPNDSISSVYVNFPDPWPKRRHAKHRLIQEDFIKEVERILTKDGILTLVTDDIPYSNQMITTVSSFTKFYSQFPDPYFVIDYEGYGISWFEELWRKEGKAIRFHMFQKLGSNE